MKKITGIILALILTLSLVACGSTGEQSQTSSAKGSMASTVESADESSAKESSGKTITSQTVGMKDREGKPFEMPKSTNKIISMAPAITQTLVNLGLGDNIIATDTYSVGTKGLKEGLPAFDMLAPDAESIVALKPDIIFATGMSMLETDSDPFKPITDLGIKMTYIPSSTSLSSIKEDISFLGLATGTGERAMEIIATMEKEITEITSKIKASNKSIYFEIAAAPSAYSFGNGTFLNEMIELLGCKNVFAEEDGWLSVSDEVILEKNPDIIFTSVNYIEKPTEEIMARQGWNVISAVKNKQVYFIDTNMSTLPNEYVTGAMLEMAKIIYPEDFK